MVPDSSYGNPGAEQVYRECQALSGILPPQLPADSFLQQRKSMGQGLPSVALPHTILRANQCVGM